MTDSIEYSFNFLRCLSRFDTKVQVPPPDLKGRKEILELYLSKIVHDSTVDVDKLARRTIGFSGAEIENMVNTAAIRAAMESKAERAEAERTPT